MRLVRQCRRLRKKGVLVTRSAGSDLIVALCKADQPQKALRVYHDMMASAFGAPGDASLWPAVFPVVIHGNLWLVIACKRIGTSHT